MADLMKLLKVALGVSVVAWLLTWLYSSILKFLGTTIATISFSAIDINVGNQISSGINTSLAGKYIGSLIGSVPVGLQTFILLLVSAVIVVALGNWINKQVGDFGGSENQKFAVDLTFGSIAVGLIVGFMSGGVSGATGSFAIGAGIATLIYFLIVAFVYGMLRSLGLKGFLSTPR